MDGILTGVGMVMVCAGGWFIGLVSGFAAVRAAGYRLLYADHRWQVRKLPTKTQHPGQVTSGTMRSLN